MVDERNFLDQPVKNSGRSFDNIRKIRNGRRDNFTTACLLHYPYFEKHQKMIAIDLGKQQELHDDLEAIDFTKKLDKIGNTKMFLILEEAKKTVIEFLQGTVRVL